jgi:hypothetical protein
MSSGFSSSSIGCHSMQQTEKGFSCRRRAFTSLRRKPMAEIEEKTKPITGYLL